MAFVAGQPLQAGKYTVERELGRGRFGITYLAKDQKGDRWVIKILNDALLGPLSQSERDRLSSMFWQEAVKLSQCRHPHIVEVAQPFVEQGQPCILMAYIDGVSLAERADRQLPEAQALEYIRQIGDALTAVHKNGLIHRDVKPANIVLRRTGEAVLIDFGLVLDCDHILTTSRDQDCFKGFTAPEMYYKGQSAGIYTDVYSLAATLYELLTGTPPTGAMERVDRKRLVPPGELNPQVSDRTNRMILKGMELNSKDRPQTVQEWLDSLGLTQPVVSNPSASASSTATVDWSKWSTVWTAAGVGVAFLSVVVALLVGLPTLMPFLQAVFQPSPAPSPAQISSPSSSKVP